MLQTVIVAPQAERYLTTLCRHFARKVPASWDEQQGVVNFTAGEVHFSRLAADRLQVRCIATQQEQLTQLQGIVESHLQMFARREVLTLDWQTL